MNMESLEKGYRSTVAVLGTLEMLLSKKPSQEEKVLVEMRRDALIKRFEYSLDSLLNYLKKLLGVHHGFDEKSPKMVIRACVKVELISFDKAELAIEMIDSRNQASHIYKEEIADIIAQKLPEYYALMKHILEVSKP